MGQSCPEASQRVGRRRGFRQPGGAACCRGSHAADVAPSAARRPHPQRPSLRACLPVLPPQFGYTVYRRVLGYYSNEEDAFGAPPPVPCTAACLLPTPGPGRQPDAAACAARFCSAPPPACACQELSGRSTPAWLPRCAVRCRASLGPVGLLPMLSTGPPAAQTCGKPCLETWPSAPSSRSKSRCGPKTWSLTEAAPVQPRPRPVRRAGGARQGAVSTASASVPQLAGPG